MTSMDKGALRARLLAGRGAGVPGAGLALAGHVLAGGAPRAGAVVAGYWPMRGEIDVRPLLLALLGRGHLVVLPETGSRGEALVFRRWRPGVAMVPGRHGTAAPAGPVGVPDVVLVPLVGFDARCHRLGYGGGYYDRTLAGLPGARTIGCGYASQQVDAVPAMPHDVALDAVATERGVLFRPEG